MLSRKAQIQAVTVVLLTGLTVGVASVVYVWGEPILDKRESQVGLDSVEQDVLTLREEILRVSEAGEGAAANVEMDGGESDFDIEMIRVEDSIDYIDIVVDASESEYPDGRWTLLKGDNQRNLSISNTGDYVLEGEDEQSVLLVRPQSSVITYRIEFRNIYSENAEGAPVEKIDLISRGGDVSSGGAEVYVTNTGTEVDTGEDGLTLSSGQTLDRSRTEIEVDLR
ncbi:hypothetical protein ACK3SF_02080 [Candidatus Nanosalina sp. VS9-1]|uniref:hypothetical protein n=1 Tax=Candidatus Nanosalina sp. VS9-1 TaxID=3388566 RepID=UPI0039DFBBE1